MKKLPPTTSSLQKLQMVRTMEQTAGPTIKEYADLMVKYKGNLSKVAEELELPVQVVRRKVRFTPQLQLVKQNIIEEKLDQAEEKLAEQVESGNVTAITYTLNNLGKQRGYGKGEDHEVNINVNHSAGLIKRLQENVVQGEDWDENQIAEVEEYEWVNDDTSEG